jgi:hypothetical protein
MMVPHLGVGAAHRTPDGRRELRPFAQLSPHRVATLQAAGSGVRR